MLNRQRIHIKGNFCRFSHSIDYFIMKRNLFFYLLLFLLCLSSCQQKNEVAVSTELPSGDSWRDVYFSETHNLSEHLPIVFYDVTVNKVFENTYKPSISEKCILVECKIEHIFFQSPDANIKVDQTTANDPVYLWINIAEYDLDTISQLKDLFETIDSAIIYGIQFEPYIVQDSTLSNQLESELEKEDIEYCNIDGVSCLNLPACIMVYDLEEWPILPIIDGCFSADSLASIIGVNDMAFSFESENPDGLQYFKSGDDVEIVYAALEKFLSEY